MQLIQMGIIVNRTTEVDRKDLLVILKLNRDAHLRDYREALEGYQTAALDWLTELESLVGADIKRLKDIISTKNDVDLIFTTTLHSGLTVPQSYAKAYDMVIRMMELEINDTVKLTLEEFQCYVMDDWKWRDTFNQTVTAYKSFRK